MTESFRKNLLGPDATMLPEEPEVNSRFTAGDAAEDVAAAFPASSLAWAELAEEALAEGRNIEGYAYARVGYHRGLDALRQNGWRGAGPVPYSHEPNRGFLRALYALGQAAGRIGEVDEAERIAGFLNESDPNATLQIENSRTL